MSTVSNISALHHLYEQICFLGGGKFQGVQPGHPRHPEPLILFCGPSGSTMALTPRKLSADRIRKMIADKEKEYSSEQLNVTALADWNGR